MKNSLLILFLLTSGAFGGLYVWQKSKTSAADLKIAELSRNLNEVQTQVTEHQQQAAQLHARLENTQAKAIAKADELVQLQQVLTNQATTNAKSSNPFAEMFKSPEMKELVKTQQKTVMSGMVDKSYGSFFNALQMTPEQSTNLKDLLMKRSMVDAGLGLSMLGGDTDAAKRKEMMDQAKTEKDAIDLQIKQFLGEDNYTQFQNYEKTLPERMSLSLYKDQQAAGPAALAPDQEEKLVQLMSEERLKFKFTTDFNDKSKFNGDFSAFFTEDKINQFQVEQAQLNQQYLLRAKEILTPEQLAPFEEFLNNQRGMQSAAMKMASKMFAPKTGGD